MIQLVRILGFVLMTFGGLVLLSYLVRPLRRLWPQLWAWFQSLPGAIQLGLIVATIGFVLLLSSVIWERLQDSKSEGDLLNE